MSDRALGHPRGNEEDGDNTDDHFLDNKQELMDDHHGTDEASWNVILSSLRALGIRLNKFDQRDILDQSGKYDYIEITSSKFFGATNSSSLDGSSTKSSSTSDSHHHHQVDTALSFLSTYRLGGSYYNCIDITFDSDPTWPTVRPLAQALCHHASNGYGLQLRVTLKASLPFLPAFVSTIFTNLAKKPYFRSNLWLTLCFNKPPTPDMTTLLQQVDGSFAVIPERECSGSISRGFCKFKVQLTDEEEALLDVDLVKMIVEVFKSSTLLPSLDTIKIQLNHRLLGNAESAEAAQVIANYLPSNPLATAESQKNLPSIRIFSYRGDGPVAIFEHDCWIVCRMHLVFFRRMVLLSVHCLKSLQLSSLLRRPDPDVFQDWMHSLSQMAKDPSCVLEKLELFFNLDYEVPKNAVAFDQFLTSLETNQSIQELNLLVPMVNANSPGPISSLASHLPRMKHLIKLSVCTSSETIIHNDVYWIRHHLKPGVKANKSLESLFLGQWHNFDGEYYLGQEELYPYLRRNKANKWASRVSAVLRETQDTNLLSAIIPHALNRILDHLCREPVAATDVQNLYKQCWELSLRFNKLG